jgi:AcrR family transcriptional regulator
VPRPRFDKLPLHRRVHILDTAGRVFAERGFQDASLNAILDQAGVSKGAAYYYFDSKEDLFWTAVQHFSRELVRLDEIDPAMLSRDTYWAAVLDFYRRPLLRARDRPWAAGLLRAANELGHSASAEAPVSSLIAELLDLARAVFKRGHELGVVRDDLPEDLLLGWVEALDSANDRWIQQNWHELDDQGFSHAAARFIDALRRLLSPPAFNEGG